MATERGALMVQDEKLRALWRRCCNDDGNNPSTVNDLNELCALVWVVLSNSYHSELYSLADGKDDYIQDYLTEKFLKEISPNKQGPDTCGALISWFRKYLISQIRRKNAKKRKYQNTVSIDVITEEEKPEDEQSGDPLNVLVKEEAHENREQALKELCGLSIKDVEKIAEDFLEALNIENHDALLILRFHFFMQYEAKERMERKLILPDELEEESKFLPLDAFKEKHGIKNPHLIAKALGNPIKKHASKMSNLEKNRTLMSGLKNSIIGDWLERDLKIQLDSANSNAIILVLEILKNVALDI